MNQKDMPLWRAHKAYMESTKVRFDVPAHKKGTLKNEMSRKLAKVFQYDINSCKEIDNLANPQTVIHEAHKLFAKAFWSDEAYFLVNGTTQGNHAMMLSAVNPGDTILMPKNIHKSALNGAILAGINIRFIKPGFDKKWGVSHNITLEALKKAKKDHPEAKAVLLLNPTYFGMVSDIKKIVTWCHKNGLTVLCDEAHGSHFKFHPTLPLSAMEAKADMSSMSIHKTGGSLTQSSAIVWNKERINSRKVWGTLAILQSTSSNYLLLSSLDAARHYLYNYGKKGLANSIRLGEVARKKINQIPGIEVFSDKDVAITKGVFDHDPSKLVIRVNDLGLTGFDVYEMLRQHYNIQVELGETNVILALVSPADKEETIDRLVTALGDISSQYYDPDHKPNNAFRVFNKELKQVLSPREAFFSETEEVSWSDAEDRISADTFMVYPPGIPILIPGQQITEELINYHRWVSKKKVTMINNASEVSKVIVVKEKQNDN